MKPNLRPGNTHFSSGPCAKRPGWSLEALSDALVGRSHRSKPGKAKLAEVIDLSRSILGIPDDYRIGIVPASDTGAVEMALWGMLGARGVDMLTWESFGEGWVTDVTKQLKLVWIPIGFLRPQSEPMAATILSARDPVAACQPTTSSPAPSATSGISWIRSSSWPRSSNSIIVPPIPSSRMAASIRRIVRNPRMR